MFLKIVQQKDDKDVRSMPFSNKNTSNRIDRMDQDAESLVNQ